MIEVYADSMGAFRIIQISDTHLGHDRRWFVPNFEAMRAIIASRRPDLVVNTGDISLDGAGSEDDLAFARRCHDGLPVPWRAVPGNHDLGDNPWSPGLGQPIDNERLARYRRHFGEDSWILEAGGWVLVGVNAQLLGSGLAAEIDQRIRLATLPSRAAGRPVALFIHKPLFDRSPDETAVTHRYVPPEQRARLGELFRGADLRLVASGHVHQHRRHREGGVEHFWGPSTAFVIPDRRQPAIGYKRVGYIEYTLFPSHVVAMTVEAPELTNHDLDEFMPAEGQISDAARRVLA